MLGALTTRCQHSRYVWRLAGLFRNRSKSKPWPRCSCDSANRLLKGLNLTSALFGKAFRLQPDCERVNSIVQVSEYQFTELGLSVVHLKDWTGLSLEITDYARAACGLQYKMDYTKIKEANITMSLPPHPSVIGWACVNLFIANPFLLLLFSLYRFPYG